MSYLAELSLAQLGQKLGARVVGDPGRIVRGVATLDQAAPDELSWLAAAKYRDQLQTTRAGAVLVSTPPADPAGRSYLVVADVEAALCDALALLAPPSPALPDGIHASACVDPSARVEGAAIGAHVIVGPRAEVCEGTQLHPGVYVGADTCIGRDCVLWPHVVVRERVRIGDRVIIHPHAVIGADGFGYIFRGGHHRKVPQIGTVLIEDDVEIGAGTMIDRAKTGATRIRRGAKIDNLVQIGHNCDIGEHCVIVSQCGLSGSCTLGRGVVLAGQVGLADHIRIGNGVQVAARSGLMRDVPDGESVWGAPAIPVKAQARQMVALARLPELVEQVRDLRKRLQQLESTTDHRE